MKQLFSIWRSNTQTTVRDRIIIRLVWQRLFAYVSFMLKTSGATYGMSVACELSMNGKS